MSFYPIAINVRSSTYLQIGFNQEVGELSIDNFYIVADKNPEDVLEIMSVDVRGKVVDITYSPSYPLIGYTVSLIDGANLFSSLSGDLLTADSSISKLQFVGPEEKNPIKTSIVESIPSIYDGEDNNSLNYYISNISKELFDAKIAIDQASNSAYIEEIETDVVLTRDSSLSRDRLPKESAYQVDRVALNPTGSTLYRGDFSFIESGNSNPVWDSFPSEPYPLNNKIRTELVSNSDSSLNSFSGLIITVSEQKIAAVFNLTLIQDGTAYIYDILNYPLLLSSSRYDNNFSVVDSKLATNQIKIPLNAIIDGVIPEPTSADEWEVEYSYIDNGMSIPSDVSIYKTVDVVREIAQPLINVFSLSNGNIVTSAGLTPTAAGVEFLNPLPTATATAYNSTHPAFRKEIAYNLQNPPSNPGEFAVDYSTGLVLVYGSDSTGNGTGLTPPACSYIYKHIYKKDVDYAIDPETNEIVAFYGRDLSGENVYLKFEYEHVLRPGIDYVAEVHNEVIGEYVQNRVFAQDKIRTLNYPVTDVFKILNETTGEVYTAASISHNEITIVGTQLPRTGTSNSEPLQFKFVENEDLFFGEVVIDDTDPVIAISLSNTGILASSSSYLGFPGDSSLSLTSNYFLNEFCYNNNSSILSNVSLLVTVGDYLVDFENGIIYVKVASGSSSDAGSASYRHATGFVGNENITYINAIRYASNGSDEEILKSLSVQYSSDEISEITLDNILSRYNFQNTDMPLILGSIQVGENGYFQGGTDIFYSVDAFFTEEHADGHHYLRIETDSDRQIVEYLTPTSVRVDIAFSDNGQDLAWQLYNSNNTSTYSVCTDYPVKYVAGVYFASEINSLPFEECTNLWNKTLDSFEDNVIYLSSDLLDGYAVGTSLAVAYSFGTIFVDYDYVLDSIIVDYEWGDNSIKWINSPENETNYFVTYRYGALRKELMSNFASMLGIDDLLYADTEIERESLRDLIKASSYSFVGGPTRSSIENLAKIPTLITPNVEELSFDEWTLDRDFLYSNKPSITGTEAWANGKWGFGLNADECAIKVSSENVLSYRDGSFSINVTPQWYGINNNAILNFDASLSSSMIWIGKDGTHPTSSIFTLSIDDSSVYERPIQFWTKRGLHIWYDEEDLRFKVAFCGVQGDSFSCEITTDGKFGYFSDGYVDGYGLETTDSKTSNLKTISLSFEIDGYDTISMADGYLNDDEVSVLDPLYCDIYSFSASKPNYFLDTYGENGSRISLFRDSFGYLQFLITDDLGRTWSLSNNITEWIPGEPHSIGCSWRLNTPTSTDEMHLFVDGEEVPNIIRFGGKGYNSNVFRSVGSETLTASLALPIVAFNGTTEAGSFVITVEDDVDLTTTGILVGQELTILEETNDGLASPYIITNITSNTIQVDSALTLSLSSVKCVINMQSFSIETSVDAKFAIFVDGEEIPGEDALIPQYTISRISTGHLVTLIGSMDAGSLIEAKTLGLTLTRCQFISNVFAD